MARASHSVGQLKNARQWLGENLAFFHMRVSDRSVDLDSVIEDIDQLDAACRKNLSRSLTECTLLEIGYGARPNRLIAMISMGIDAMGIDLDQPILNTRMGTFFEIFRRNGAKRAVKTMVRHFLFDARERRKLAFSLSKRGRELKIEQKRFLVGDATRYDFNEAQFDLVFSHDVFEHIPEEDLVRLLQRLGKIIKPNGLLITTPLIFTGISGSHLPEWYPHAIERGNKTTAPWEHLRQRRTHADCYLNELRVADYRRIFSAFFEIVEEVDVDNRLGEILLTDEILAELPGYTRDELLANRVRFVLRNRWRD